jgi:hypothetical protein
LRNHNDIGVKRKAIGKQRTKIISAFEDSASAPSLEDSVSAPSLSGESIAKRNNLGGNRDALSAFL